ncbi:SRPBCC domain-containing protein [Streptomyces tsukubensis]|uniref:Carbon monoxide dehydrogenase n=1 Tax=Streptomyces tsukubensis TaxID=83656 RepID=A0A1V4A2C4_9ACTN|nr:SRPBCC domain-containing protein [Streptomyces tsukubensis]OON73843.1 carbon monoxide dehydrogenase [Streptomyces tsukubensis]QFR91784.1 carbon monoxide dehydrogenase [Streptomyces tsukubensis]
MISITEEIAVPSPPERVWEVISDPSAVVSCIGGAELGPSHDDGSFDGTLAIRFGGLRVKFAARITLDLDEPAHEGRLTARGADGQGATRFSAGATFRVVEGETPGTSRVFCDGEIKLNGKLAKLIESGAGMVVSRMTKEFTDQLVQKCASPTGPVTAAPAPGPVTAPAPGPVTAASAGSVATSPAQPPTTASARQLATPEATEPRAATPVGTRTPQPRPTGLFARLRAWWAGRRSGRQGQAPRATRGEHHRSDERLGQGGRR